MDLEHSFFSSFAGSVFTSRVGGDAGGVISLSGKSGSKGESTGESLLLKLLLKLGVGQVEGVVFGV